MSRVRLLVAAVASVAFVAGCGHPPAERSPYAAEYDAAMERASEDFVRQALSDYRITDQEYGEATDRAVSCAAGQGVTVKVLSPGYSVSGGSSANDVFDDCSRRFLSDIELLYNAAVQNPENVPFEDLVVECLVRNGVVDAGYGRADYDRDMSAGTGPFAHLDSDPVALKCATTPREG